MKTVHTPKRSGNSAKRIASSLTALFIASFITSCSDDQLMVEKQIDRPVKLYTVTDSHGQYSRTFPARVAAAKTTNLAFRINGELKKLAILSGQKVKKNSIIARLDDKDIKQDLKNANSAYDLAKANYDRNLPLFEQGVIPKSIIDNAQRQLQLSEANLDKAKNYLSYSVLRAPFAGVIARVDVENFQTIGANQTIAILQGENVLEVTIQVPESIIMSVRNDGSNRTYHPNVVFPSLKEQSFKATYKEHATTPNPGSQTYDVTFTMLAPKNLTILPGMTASVIVDLTQITRGNHDNVLIVPNSAVTHIDGEDGSYVWKFSATTQTIAKQKVELGKIQDSGIEIKSGLAPQDQVVIAGLNLLKEGMKVKPLHKEPGL